MLPKTATLTGTLANGAYSKTNNLRGIKNKTNQAYRDRLQDTQAKRDREQGKPGLQRQTAGHTS